MSTSTLFLIFAVVMLACCVGPMLFMRHRRGRSRGDDNSKSPPRPTTKNDV